MTTLGRSRETPTLLQYAPKHPHYCSTPRGQPVDLQSAPTLLQYAKPMATSRLTGHGQPVELQSAPKLLQYAMYHGNQQDDRANFMLRRRSATRCEACGRQATTAPMVGLPCPSRSLVHPVLEPELPQLARARMLHFL